MLIDPLSQRVYAIQRVTTSSGRFALTNLPLLNHPLIVTDRAVVPILS